MTEVVTRLVVRADGSLAVLDQFEKGMADAGRAADYSTGAVADFEQRMEKARQAMERGNAVSTQTVARKTAEQRAYERWSASLDKTAALRIRLENEAAKASVTAANAVVMGYATQEQALASLMQMESAHHAQLERSVRGVSGAIGTAAMQSRQLMYQMVDMGQAIPLLLQSPIYGLQNMGFQIAQIGQMYYGQGGMGAALKDMGAMLGGALARIAPLTMGIAAAAAAVAGLTYEINKTSDVHVGFFDVVQAGWQLMAENIGSTLAPVWDWIVGRVQWVWDAISPILKTIGNGIIGAFAFAVQAIGALWNGLPAAIGDAMITTANVIVKGIEWSINAGTRLLNDFLSKYNEGLAMMGQAPIPLASGISLGQQDNPYQGALGRLGIGISGAASSAFSTDFMGDAFGALSARAQQIAAARQEMDALGGSAKAANDNVKALANDGFGSAKSAAQSFAQAAMSAFSNLGTGIIDAFKKGGDVGMNVLNMLLDKVGQLGENLLNQGLNGLFGGLFGGMFGGHSLGAGWGVAGGFAGFPGIFGIPGMADGGTVARSGLSWVGERGPELLRLPQGAQVIPNGPSVAMAANQNGDLIIHNHISVPPGTSPETAPALAREITKEIRRQLPDAMERYNRNPLRRATN